MTKLRYGLTSSVFRRLEQDAAQEEATLSYMIRPVTSAAMSLRHKDFQAQQSCEIIFDARSASQSRALTLQASAQPHRACLPPSGAGSRQGPWQLPR
jgi:hypothetical protein